MHLDRILSGVSPLADRPPVEHWNPRLSGDMDLVIQHDGRWVHEGTPMVRHELVQLFARILRREDDGDYYLVTPVEKWRIQVEDCAFIVVSAEFKGDAGEPDLDRPGLDEKSGAEQQRPVGTWWLTTNVGERIALGREHRLSLSRTPSGDSVPEVNLRLGLAARLGRNVFYQLVEQGQQQGDSSEMQSSEIQRSEIHGFGIYSAGIWQPLGYLDDTTPGEVDGSEGNA